MSIHLNVSNVLLRNTLHIGIVDTYIVVATKLVSSLLIKTSLMSIQLAVVLSAYSSISSGLLLVAALSITTPLYWGMLLKFYSLFITLDNYQYFIHHS